MADNERVLTANFTADTSGFAPKINELIQKLKTLNQDFEQNKQKVNELNAKIKEYQKELNQLNSATNNGANATTQQSQRMQTLRDNIAACNTQIGTYRAAQATLRSEINSTNRELTEQQNAFNGVNTSAMTFGEILKANLASSAIQAGLRTTLNYLREAAAYCYQVGSSFEASMSQVAAVSGASAEELEQLTAKAKELGSSTKFTASETAEAMNYMAMAGWKTEEMLSGIDGVLGLAAASGTDLATTSDIVTDALTAFGLSAADCGHFADVLAAAASNANTNVSMMGETFKYCAPIAGALGFSAEDVAVGVGLMANSGIKATQAGTAMRTVMTALANDVKITGEAIGDVTVKTTNADGSMREFSDILSELRGVFSQLTESEKSNAAESIAGKNALSGFLALMNAGEADVQKLTAAIENCDGAASAMAETMQDNVQGAVTKFNSALEGVGIAVYDKFKDGLAETVNIFTEAMSELTEGIEEGQLDQSLENLAESFKGAAREIAQIVKNDLPGFINGLTNAINFVVKFRKEIASAAAGFIAYKSAMSIGVTAIKTATTAQNGFKASMTIGGVVSAAVTSIKNFVTAIKTATTAQNGFKAAMAATPWGAVAAGVGLLVGVVVDLAMRTKEAAVSVDDLREKSQELAQATAEYKQKAKDLRDIKDQYEEIYNAVDPDVDKTQALKDLQDQLIDQFPELANKIDLVSGAYRGVVEELQGLIDKTDEAYKISANGTLDSLKKTERDKATEIEAPSGGTNDLFYEFWGDVNKYMQGLKTYKLVDGKVTFQGSYEDRLADMEALNEWLETNWGYMKGDEYYSPAQDSVFAISIKQKIGEVAKLRDELAAAQAEFDRLNSSAEEDAAKARPHSRNKFVETDLPITKEEKENAYKEEKQLADDMYSVGELSAQQYYNKLTELRDTYLEKQSHAWYQATAQIQSVHEKMASGVKSALSEVEMAYKKTLDAIDAEIERHNREKSDAAFQQKIDEIDEQLAYGRLDDFSKYELEKERQRLIDEHNEELYERQAADAKAMIRDVYNAKTTLDKADIGTREYTLAVGDYTDALQDLTEVMRGVGVALGVENGGSTTNNNNIDESTKNYYSNIVLQAVNKSNSQLIDELIKALHSGL